MANKQLALGLVLRFTDSGSSAAKTALDGVGRALDGVSGAGVRAAEASDKARRGIIGVGDASTVVTRTTTASSGALVVWSQRAKVAETAATSAARGITTVGTASNVASRSVAAITTQAQAATRALERMHSAVMLTAAGVGGNGGGGWSSGPLLLGGPSGGARRRAPAADVTDAVVITRHAPSSGSRAEALLNGGRGVMAVGAGYVAGKMVLAPPVSQTMSYERRLAHLANTGAPEGSLAERQALMGTMDGQIMAAVRAGGGSREGALDTLDKLVASGVYKSPADAMKDLPALLKFGTASGADPGELAAIAVKARQSMGVTDLGAVLGKAMRAGQLGGFELRDQAKWLPAQMAEAKGAGLSGIKGLETLLVANQAAAAVSGSTDQAGNAVVNLLGKISSEDFANNAKKLGIDSAGSLLKAREKGTNTLDAVVNLVEQVAAKDPRMMELSKKAAAATGDEKKAMYADMAEILKGTAIGKLIQDREARLALVGLMQQKHIKDGKNTESMRGDVSKTGAEAGDSAHELIASLPSYKAEMLAAEKANAMQQALNNVNPLLGKMADWLSGVARDYPTFAAATVGATTALAALAAAAGAASLAQALGGGAGGVGAGALAARAAAGAMKAPVSLSAGLGLGVGAAGLGGYMLGTVLYDRVIQGSKAGDVIGESIAQIAAFFGNQTAQNALNFARQNEAAQALKEAADKLKEAKPVVALDMAQLDRDIQNYQQAEARRK